MLGLTRGACSNDAQDTELDRQQTKYINTLLSAGGSLMSLVNDFLDLSKLENGAMALEELPLVRWLSLIPCAYVL